MWHFQVSLVIPSTRCAEAWIKNLAITTSKQYIPHSIITNKCIQLENTFKYLGPGVYISSRCGDQLIIWHFDDFCWLGLCPCRSSVLFARLRGEQTNLSLKKVGQQQLRYQLFWLSFSTIYLSLVKLIKPLNGPTLLKTSTPCLTPYDDFAALYVRVVERLSVAVQSSMPPIMLMSNQVGRWHASHPRQRTWIQKLYEYRPHLTIPSSISPASELLTIITLESWLVSNLKSHLLDP